MQFAILLPECRMLKKKYRGMGDGRERVAIENVAPQVDCGRFPAKRVSGDSIIVEADVFADGHDAVSAVLLYRHSKEAEWQRVPMKPVVNDRWSAEFTVDQVGSYQYKVAGWVDHFATWKRDLGKRVAAGQDVSIDLQVGAELVRQGSSEASGRDRELLAEWEEVLRSEATRNAPKRIVESDELTALMARVYRPVAVSESRELTVIVDRPRASFSAWYEMFPRSASGSDRHGTLKDVEKHLPYVASMGFDVLYLPPIHPIGQSHRKGPNNAEAAGPERSGQSVGHW